MQMTTGFNEEIFPRRKEFDEETGTDKEDA